MNASLLALALLASPTPTAAGPATFQGIALGQPATAMIATQGEPVAVSSGQGGDDYIYLGARNNALVFVRVVRGNVVGVAVKPAPWQPAEPAPFPSALGVALNDPIAAVAKIPKSQFVTFVQHGQGADVVYLGQDGLTYTFTGGDDRTITWIRAQLSDAAAKALVDSPAPVLHDGSSEADAIIDIAPSEDVGVRAEYVYLALHPCGTNGSWKTQKQALVHDGKRSYDLMSETCSDGGASRDFYFDITGYFGKDGF